VTSSSADMSCLTCARYRACPDCGYGLFDLIPRSIDPVWLRCSRCGREIAMPMHFHPWDKP
jgi:hypothetical protein